jgi:hypothetical protein
MGHVFLLPWDLDTFLYDPLESITTADDKDAISALVYPSVLSASYSISTS